VTAPPKLVRALTAPLFGRRDGAAARRLARRYLSSLWLQRARKQRVRRRLMLALTGWKVVAVRRLAAILADVVHAPKTLESPVPQRQLGGENLASFNPMLARSVRRCTDTKDEGVHFIVGSEFDGLCNCTHIIRVPCAHRSVAGAEGDPHVTYKIVFESCEARRRLIARNHPYAGSGPRANHPSSIDEQIQGPREAGWPMHGGIRSRDGYLRWNSVDEPFQVEVIGSRMEKADERPF